MCCERCEKEIPVYQKIRIAAEGSPYPGTNEIIGCLCLECFKELLKFFYIDEDVLRDMALGHLEDEITLALDNFPNKEFLTNLMAMIARVLDKDIAK